MNELIYNGVAIRDRGEMLNLTDMWRSAGRDLQKQVSKWRDLPSVKEFCGHIAATLGKSESELFQVLNENGEWNTWGHWQPALAYAKYLSPALHAEANKVWRAQIEGKLIPAPVEEDRSHLLARALIEAYKEIEENREDATAFRRIAPSSGSQNLTDTAKLLRMKRDDLIKWMHEHHWIYRRMGNKEWVGYDAHTKNGDLEHVLQEIPGRDGTLRMVEQVRVAMKGIAKLTKIFANAAA